MSAVEIGEIDETIVGSVEEIGRGVAWRVIEPMVRQSLAGLNPDDGQTFVTALFLAQVPMVLAVLPRDRVLAMLRAALEVATEHIDGPAPGQARH